MLKKLKNNRIIVMGRFMNTEFSLPYQIGQELFIVEKIKKYIKTEKIYTRNTPNIQEYYEKCIYEDVWVVKRKFLKEITIDINGIMWTFANNADLTDDDEWDEDHSYKCFLDNEIYIFTNELEANNQALSLNVLEKLTK